MKKKSLIVFFTLFFILFANTIVFATDMTNKMNNITNSMENGVSSTGQMLKNGVENIENTVENGTQNIGNGIENVVESTGNFIQNTGENIRNTYMASRTSTQDMQNTGMRSARRQIWIM